MVSHSLILPKVNGLLYEVNIQYIITFLWLLRCERVQIQVPGGITAKITDKTAAVRQTDRQTDMQPHIAWDCKWQLSGLNIWDSAI